MNKLIGKFKCLIGEHHWTSAIEEGIKPSHEQLKSGVNGFFNYATMYCKRCGKVYIPYNNRK